MVKTCSRHVYIQDFSHPIKTWSRKLDSNAGTVMIVLLLELIQKSPSKSFLLKSECYFLGRLSVVALRHSRAVMMLADVRDDIPTHV